MAVPISLPLYMQILLSTLSAIFFSRLVLWKRLIAGLVVGGFSTWLLFHVDGTIESQMLVGNLRIDESVKAALQSGVDAGKSTYNISSAQLAIIDSPTAGFASCKGDKQVTCTFTFGRPLNDQFFKKNLNSARAIALHEVGHGVAYKQGIRSNWLAYAAFFAMITIAAAGMSSHLLGMLLIGASFTLLHAILYKFPYGDLQSYQFAIALLLAIAFLVSVQMAIEGKWRIYPKHAGFAANPYIAAAAALSFVLISHLNDKLEAYSDLMAACEMESTEPIRKGLSRLMDVEGPKTPRVIAWVFDPFHPSTEGRLDALARLEENKSFLQQCLLVKNGSSAWVAGSY